MSLLVDNSHLNNEVTRIEKEEQVVPKLVSFAVDLFEKEQYPEAIQVANRIYRHDREANTRLLSQFAETLFSKDHFENALHAAVGIASVEVELTVLRDFSEKCYQGGNAERAIEAARVMTRPEEGTKILMLYARTFIQEEKLELAEQAAHAIFYLNYREKNELFMEISFGYLRLCPKERTLVEKAVAIAKQISYQADRDEHLKNLALAFVKMHYLKEAKSVAEEIYYSEIRSEALQGIAKGHYLCGEWDQALAVADSVSHKTIRSDLLFHFYRVLMGEDMLDKAADVACRIPGGGGGFLSHIAQTYLSRGEVERAFEAARRIPEADSNAGTAMEMVMERCLEKNVLEFALKAARANLDPYKKSVGLRKIIVLWIEMEKSVEELEGLVLEIPFSSVKEDCQSKISSYAARRAPQPVEAFSDVQSVKSGSESWEEVEKRSESWEEVRSQEDWEVLDD